MANISKYPVSISHSYIPTSFDFSLDHELCIFFRFVFFHLITNFAYFFKKHHENNVLTSIIKRNGSNYYLKNRYLQ